MRCHKKDYMTSQRSYAVEIFCLTDGNEHSVCRMEFQADPSGLAALIRSVDVATNDDRLPRAIGLRAKKKKNGG